MFLYLFSRSKFKKRRIQMIDDKKLAEKVSGLSQSVPSVPIDSLQKPLQAA
jgi:hypothetical protein